MRLIYPGAGGGEVTDERLAELYGPIGGERPLLRINFVASTDGAATLDGRSGGLSNEADTQVFQLLRDVCDVVLVGAGTVRAESYEGTQVAADRQSWREAHGLPPQPRLAVVSSALDLAPSHRIFSQARPILITHAGSPADKRAELSAVADLIVTGVSTVDLTDAVRQLRELGLRHILCEGGPLLHGALQAEDLVDELCLTISPMSAGPGAPRITEGAATFPRQLSLAHALEADGMLILRYTRA
ncbi:pyrimidine reductase family protein [Fodinicola acaciae]|uniref:pyrimidine reductase family protein n=1 Tax=Fodinicola acaciae TaxID=2681555 RepID=UPI0013D845D8|nr:pyrimidine reductase family protein [Fodinicola acaciae]